MNGILGSRHSFVINYYVLLFEPSLLFHMRQLLSEITSSSDRVISQLEAGPDHYAIMRPNIKEEVQEVRS